MRLATVTLAAGLGTRMKSHLPKILHKIYDKPIIQYVIESLLPLSPEKSVVVVSSGFEAVENYLKDYPVVFAVQEKQKGTADALKSGVGKLEKFDGVVLVVNGDTPLITSEVLRNFIDLHKNNSDDISILSFIANGSHSYGRIIRSGDEVLKIIEDRDADETQKKINEVNSGIYAFKSHILKLLDDIKINEKKGEYYLTDIVDITVSKGYKVCAHNIASESELTGINTREDLYNAFNYLRDRISKKWLDNGVTILDKNTAFIHPNVQIGTDTIIYPNVYLEGKTIIGSNCTIYPNTRIVNSIIAHNVIIKDSSIIESSEIMENAVIGPFAHIRPDSIIGQSSKIGNFVEIKKSVLGSGVKASHLSYLGDSEIGSNVNIGAGTITCNYDGRLKHKTIIEDDVFIGSDTQLVAPVKVGKGSYVGAGSTITKDVPSGALAASRVKQKNIEGWAERKKKKND